MLFLVATAQVSSSCCPRSSQWLSIYSNGSTYQIRRIQMKFHNAVDFNKALRILKDLEFPIAEAVLNTSSNVRPSPSPATSMFSSVSSSSAATLGPSLPAPVPMRDFHGNSSPSLPSSSVSGFKTPLRPDVFSLEPQRPATTQPCGMVPMIKSSVNVHPTRSSSAFASGGFHDAGGQLPSLYVSQMGREVRAVYYFIKVLSLPSIVPKSSSLSSDFPIFHS